MQQTNQRLKTQLFKRCRVGTAAEISQTLSALTVLHPSTSVKALLTTLRTRSDETALHQVAAHNRDPATPAALLLSLGADVSAREGTHLKTPLHHAAHRAHPALVRLLLSHGAQPDEVKKGDWTALMLVAGAGDASEGDALECVEILLAAGAGADRRNRCEETALHVAARTGSVGVVRALVERDRGCVKWEARNGRLGIHFAARAGRLDCLKVLVSGGADIESLEQGGMTAAHEAAAGGKVETLRWCLEVGGEAVLGGDVGGGTVLHHAVLEGGVEVLRVVLEVVGERKGREGVAMMCRKKDRQGFTPVFLAVWMGRGDVLRELVDGGGVVELAWVEEMRRLGRGKALRVLQEMGYMRHVAECGGGFDEQRRPMK